MTILGLFCNHVLIACRTLLEFRGPFLKFRLVVRLVVDRVICETTTSF